MVVAQKEEYEYNPSFASMFMSLLVRGSRPNQAGESGVAEEKAKSGWGISKASLVSLGAG